jgi:hypothetical protein
MKDHQLQLLSQPSELIERGYCSNLEALVLSVDVGDEHVPIDALNSLTLECESRGIGLEFKAPE